MKSLATFRFWCQKVLPLVYDDSISYYEVLCKVCDYLNDMIDNQKEMSEEIQTLQSELKTVQEWIANFEPNVANDIIEKYIARGVYFGLNDAGYFVAYIPITWMSLNFGTTGYDYTTPLMPDYGHLVLHY